MRQQKRGSVCIYHDRRRGTWRIQVTRADRTRASYTARTKGLAEEIAEHLRAQLEDQCQTIHQAIDMYLGELKSQGVSDASRVTERSKLHALFPLEDQLLSELHPIVAQRMYDDLVATGVAVDTHRNTLNSARSMCKWLRKKQIIDDNPFSEVEGKGKRKRGKPQLTRDEAAKWLDVAAADSDVRTTAAMCCLLLGMRCGEIIGLTPRSLDCGGTVVVINRGTTKSDAGARPLEVPDCLRDRMPALCEARLVHNQIYRRVHRICKQAGVPLVCPHGLRGTHASLARAAGATSQLVSTSLGHASTKVTEAHYTRPEVTRQADTAVALRVITGGLANQSQHALQHANPAQGVDLEEKASN